MTTSLTGNRTSNSPTGVETGEPNSDTRGIYGTADPGDLGERWKDTGIFCMSPNETTLLSHPASDSSYLPEQPRITSDTPHMDRIRSATQFSPSQLNSMHGFYGTPSTPDTLYSSPDTPVSFHLSPQLNRLGDPQNSTYFHQYLRPQRDRKESDAAEMHISPCTSFGSSLSPSTSTSLEPASFLKGKGKGKETYSFVEQSTSFASSSRKSEINSTSGTAGLAVPLNPGLFDDLTSLGGPSQSTSLLCTTDPHETTFPNNQRFSPPATTTTLTTDVHLTVQPQSSTNTSQLAIHLRSRSPTPSASRFHSTVSFQYTLSEPSNVSTPALVGDGSTVKHAKESIISLLRKGRGFTRRKGKEKAKSKNVRPTVVHQNSQPRASFVATPIHHDEDNNRRMPSSSLLSTSLPNQHFDSFTESIALARPEILPANEIASSSRNNSVMVDAPHVSSTYWSGDMQADMDDISSLGSSTIKCGTSTQNHTARGDNDDSAQAHEGASSGGVLDESGALGRTTQVISDSRPTAVLPTPSLLTEQRSQHEIDQSRPLAIPRIPSIMRSVGRGNTLPIPPSLNIHVLSSVIESSRIGGTSNGRNPDSLSEWRENAGFRRILSSVTSRTERPSIQAESSSTGARVAPSIPPNPLTSEKSTSSSVTDDTQLRTIPGAFNTEDWMVEDTVDEIVHEPDPPPLVDLFTRVLPHELRIEVLRFLMSIHIQEHDELMQSDEWSFGMATKTGKHAKGSKAGPAGRWVGFESGVRELVKIGRVSKSWQSLSLDGQLWATTSFSPFPHIPIPLLLRITKSVGPFMKTLDLRGVSGITADVLMDLAENIRAKSAVNYGESGQEEFGTQSRLSTAPDSLRLHKSSRSRRSRFGSLHSPALRPAETQLTLINLQGCTSVTTKSLHNLLASSPALETLILRGLSAVTNTTCEILGDYFDLSARGRGSSFAGSRLVHLDLGRCSNMNATGLERMIGFADVKFFPAGMWSRLDQQHQIPLRRFPRLNILKLGGLKKITGQTIFSISWGLPSLEVLDLRGSNSITDEDVGELGKWDERFEDITILASQTRCARVNELSRDSVVPPFEKISLTSRQMGLNPLNPEKHYKRVTRLKHILLSSCSRLTDSAASNLAYSVPHLQLLEMGGIGAGIRDTGLIRLFGTTPSIKRIDLEEASDITDDLLDALTPPAPATVGRAGSLSQQSPQAGQFLEHIVLSYAGNITDNGLLALVHGCMKLKRLEVDNTRVSDHVLKEFVKTCRQRELKGAEILAVDCRNVTRNVLDGSAGSSVRYRRGWRGWDAKTLGYYDERDKPDLMSGIDAIQESMRIGDECNENLVVMKSFHTWQAVDTMTAVRERRRKLILSRRYLDGAASATAGPSHSRRDAPRWLGWRSMSVHQAHVAGGFDLEDVDERGCVIM